MGRTKEIVREVGRDVGRGLAGAGRAVAYGVGQVVCKASYPVLGNLSSSLQDKIEGVLRNKYYDALDAYKTTRVTNYLTRLPTFVYLAGRLVYDDASFVQDGWLTEDGQRGLASVIAGLTGLLVSGIFTFFEGCARDNVIEDSMKGYEGRDYCASLVGKVVSLPFEGLGYVCSKGKEYLGDVGERVDSRRQREGLEDEVDGGGE